MGSSWADHKFLKLIILKCCLLLFYTTTTNHFSIGLWCVTKSGFCAMPSSVVGPRSSKALPKAKLAPRKGHSHCLMVCSQPVWSTIAFWIPKPFHLRSMLSKLMRYTKNYICSQHWSIERVWLSSMTTPDSTSHNQRFKSWTNWAMKFCLICHIHLTSRQLMPLLQASQQLWGKGKHFHNQQKAENAFQEFVKS